MNTQIIRMQLRSFTHRNVRDTKVDANVKSITKTAHVFKIDNSSSLDNFPAEKKSHKKI